MKIVSAIVVAAGSGKRFGGYKQFEKLAGKLVYQWPLETFLKVKNVYEIILVVPKNFFRRIQNRHKNNKVIKVIVGGDERFDSVKKALALISEDVELVAIHDAARPLIEKSIIEKSIKDADKFGASAVAVAAIDTIKYSGGGIFANRTIPREKIFLAQTPQVFRKALIKKAYSKIRRKATDDSELVEKLGKKVKITPGNAKNFKLTTKDDLKLLEFWLKK